MDGLWKRLKGLLKLGHLPKNYPKSAGAWMQLKLLLALVIEKLCYHARFPAGVYRLELQSLGTWQEMTDSGGDEQAWVQ